MKKSVLRKYAQLIAKMGVNVQKGQNVFIQCGLDQPEFVQILMEECYRLGARKVIVDWDYAPLEVVRSRHESIKAMGTLEPWAAARWEDYEKNVPCRIYLESDDPDVLKNANMTRYSKGRSALLKAIKPYRNKIESKYQWCIAAVPGEKWAKKLFPQLTKKQAVEKLWEVILSCARADEDPIKAWEDHNADLKKRTAYLNSLDIQYLHYEAGSGTDFTVEMIDGGVFAGGTETNIANGITFNPNIPSEEAFTSPLNTSADGIVYASKPLIYNGQVIDRFWIKFKEGKAVEWHADVNNDALTTLINTDEGSCRLGECALVPYTSPIQQSGILFYNTLFDENATCHLALGFGFPDCIKDFETKTLDEIHAMGVNESTQHSDFMIGTADLSIVATTRNGKKVQIFKNGVWAF